MKCLAVDVGTGTQDILYFDSRLDIENAYKMILPSPTMMIYRQIQDATRRKVPVLLSGFIMGGGPNLWAAKNHIASGQRVFAEPEAALSFNDDLEVVREMGVTIVSDDEVRHLPDGIIRLTMKDFDFQTIRASFLDFGVSLDDLGLIAVAVFDHGNAPKEISDRKFRFAFFDQQIRKNNSLASFAYQASRIPPSLTRMQAVAKCAADLPFPLVVMDTAPAAILGATLDPTVAARPRKIIANIGNMHTLAFRLGPDGIEGMFEHHTGMLDLPKLDVIFSRLADGSLTNEQVFADHGHGALFYGSEPLQMDNADFNLVIVGPRWSLMRGSAHKPYFAVPFGDMMLSGCFGLLAAASEVMPDLKEEILNSAIFGKKTSLPPWEVD
jgi:uncharacterized protein (DUF1786 family)